MPTKSKITPGRGVLTPRVQIIAKAALGRKITLRELRLIPYVQYVMVNERRLNPNHVNQEERDILAEWKKSGWIEGGAGGLSMTKQFWDSMCEILWAAYATYDDPGEQASNSTEKKK